MSPVKGRPPKEVRKYAKERFNHIIQHPNYVPNELYPTSVFKFVAWWDARFGIGDPPASSVVEVEIAARNPQFYDGPVRLPSNDKLRPLAERIGTPNPTISRNEPLANRIGSRIENADQSPSLGERIGGSLSSRIHGKLATRTKPRSIEDRIDGGIRKKA